MVNERLFMIYQGYYVHTLILKESFIMGIYICIIRMNKVFTFVRWSHC